MLPFLFMANVDPLLAPEVARVARAFRRAQVLMGWSDKETAYRMGISPSQLSKQLGSTGLNQARVALLGPEFNTHYLPLYAAAVGVPLVASTPEARLVNLEVAVARWEKQIA